MNPRIFINWMGGILSLWLAGFGAAAAGHDQPRAGFVGLADFSDFRKNQNGDAVTLISPKIIPPVQWNELIVSWNAAMTAGDALKLEARGLYPDHATKFYTLALWSTDPSRHPRESVNGQKDADGDVLTDTLALNRPGAEVELRVTLTTAATDLPPRLKFLGLSFCDTQGRATARSPNKAAWGRSIAVPERSQLAYPGGEVWCSPTSTSMVLAHWGERLRKPDLVIPVPEVARAVFDKNWPGTGNWPFNTAFAGSFTGVRAYVARFNDTRDLEEWIERGIPVITSVSYNVLKGLPRKAGDGHLVVCAGFTETGDVIVNDPGVRQKVRRVYPRDAFEKAWAFSQRTVYLIHPESLGFHGAVR